MNIREGATVQEKLHEMAHVEWIRRNGIDAYRRAQQEASWRLEQAALDTVMQTPEWTSGFNTISREEKIDAIRYLIERHLQPQGASQEIIAHYQNLISQLRSAP